MRAPSRTGKPPAAFMAGLVPAVNAAGAQILFRVQMFGYLFEECLVCDFLDLWIRRLDIFRP